MRILLLSNLYAPEPTGVGPMSSQLAGALANAGHDVKVIAANPSYPYWKLFDGYSPWRWSREQCGKVEVHRCPLYVPAEVGGITRILHYGSFAASALIPALRLARRFRPDVVMLVAPTLIAAPVALLAARLVGARTWLHVQDFEVEAGFATGQMRPGGLIARAALGFESACIRAFDAASSISAAMCRKLVDKRRGGPVYELRNWAHAQVVERSSLFRERWNIRTPHVALYSGSLARKQGIGIVVEIARLLRHRRDITFVLCGAGPTRTEMEAQAAGLDNIQFHDLQPAEEVGDLLHMATIHLLPQRADAADLVLPSKLANMLASGRPVIVGAAPERDLAKEVEGCGLAVEPENPHAMAQAIELLADDTELYARLGRAAARRAQDNWQKESIIARFEHELRQLLRQGRGSVPTAASEVR